MCAYRFIDGFLSQNLERLTILGQDNTFKIHQAIWAYYYGKLWMHHIGAKFLEPVMHLGEKRGGRDGQSE